MAIYYAMAFARRFNATSAGVVTPIRLVHHTTAFSIVVNEDTAEDMFKT